MEWFGDFFATLVETGTLETVLMISGLPAAAAGVAAYRKIKANKDGKEFSSNFDLTRIFRRD